MTTWQAEGRNHQILLPMLDQAAVDQVQARLDYLVAKAQVEAIVGREI